MSTLKKLIEAIRNNPKDVRLDDACKLARRLGFNGAGGSGSHRAFSRPGEPVGLNFQDRGGRIAPYQARQLIAMIDKYEDEIPMTIERYPKQVFWSDEDEAYIALASDLPGCSAVAPSEAKALEELDDAIAAWIEAATAAGNPIPQPSRPGEKMKVAIGQ